MCIECGAEVGPLGARAPPGAPGGKEAPGGGGAPGARGRTGLSYLHGALEVRAEYAERLRSSDLERVLRERRLRLVLDLDHTVLNSALFTDLSDEENALLARRLAEQDPAAPGLFRLERLGLWTKLRPQVREFLREAAPLYELWIYTMGDRRYAHEMASLLDPSGTLFDGRIISSQDSTARKTKDLDVVLGCESAALILDDSPSVWPRHGRNLLVMERYHYHPSSLKSFKIAGASLSARGTDEHGPSGPLGSALGVLQRVHARYFAARDADRAADVRDELAEVRAGVLRGARIVFSGVIPLGLPDPSAHPVWREASELGAACSLELDAGVTHVVAGADGTSKVLWARERGKCVVKPAWLRACGYLWRRVEEERYALRPGSGGSGPPPPPRPWLRRWPRRLRSRGSLRGEPVLLGSSRRALKATRGAGSSANARARSAL